MPVILDFFLSVELFLGVSLDPRTPHLYFVSVVMLSRKKILIWHNFYKSWYYNLFISSLNNYNLLKTHGRYNCDKC